MLTVKIIKAKFPGSGSRQGYAVVFTNAPARTPQDVQRYATQYFLDKKAAQQHANDRYLTYLGV